MVLYEKRIDLLHVWTRKTLTFPAHFHDSIEIAFMEKGEADASADFGTCRICDGDLFIVFPNMIHSYSDQGGVFARLLIIPRTMAGGFDELLSGSVPKSPLIKNAARNVHIKSLIDTIEEKRMGGGRFVEEIVCGYVTALLGEIFSMMELGGADTAQRTTERRIISYCAEHYTDELTLSMLSDAVHISKSRASHIFSENFKMGFCEFLGIFRVNDAKGRLRRGESISEAAFSSGFSSLRSFDRVFLSVAGTTPKEYRRRALEEHGIKK